MVRELLATIEGPVLVMMPYGPADSIDPTVGEGAEGSVLEPELVRAGESLAIVSVGNKVRACLEAAERLAVDGPSCSVINLRRLKPLPEAALTERLAPFTHVATVEEAVLDGGVAGASIAALLLARGGTDKRLLRLGLPTAFIEPGSNAELEAAYGLDGEGLARRIRAFWQDQGATPA